MRATIIGTALAVVLCIGAAQAQRTKTTPSPAEFAVSAVKDNDPADLSFSGYEFILSCRDASAASKEAADKVWAAIQAKQKNGAAKPKIAMKNVEIAPRR